MLHVSPLGPDIGSVEKTMSNLGGVSESGQGSAKGQIVQGEIVPGPTSFAEPPELEPLLTLSRKAFSGAVPAKGRSSLWPRSS